MKKIIIISLIVATSIFVGCMTWIKYPEKPYNKKTNTWIQPQECWYYDLCKYYRAKMKGKGDSCIAEYTDCKKARIYKKCKKKEFRLKGHTFDNCWQYLD